MVAPQDGDPVPVTHFECNQEADCLHRMVPSIYIVPHEEVVGVGAVPSYPEEL